MMKNYNHYKIGEILKIKHGKSQKSVEDPDGKFPIMGSGGIIGLSKSFMYNLESVLIGRKGTINVPKYMNKPFWAIDTIFYSEINELIAYPKLVYYLFNTIDWLSYNEASGVPSLSASTIEKISIKLPDLPTQKRIAKILSTVDGQIEKTDAIIAKYQAIKQGMLHDLFTRGIDLSTDKLRPTPEQAPELYKPSPLGLIPKCWNVELLKDLTTNIGDGLHSTPKYTENTEYYFINGNNLCENKISLNKNTNTVSEVEYNKYKIKLDENTIFMSINGTIGNLSFYNNEKIILGKSVAYINCNTHLVNRDFIYYQLQSHKLQKYLIDELTGSTIKNLSLKSIRFANMVYPNNKEEQDIIDSKLNLITNLTFNEQCILHKLQKLKNSLISKLLNGDV